MKMTLFVVISLLGLLALAGWLLRGAYQDIGTLKEKNATQALNIKMHMNNIASIRAERNQLDNLLANQKKEANRVDSNLKKQIEALTKAANEEEDNDCANALVSLSRINILQHPVWHQASATDSEAKSTQGIHYQYPLPNAP